jgi:hypothetical protein
MLKPEYYLIIKGEDDKRVSEDQYKSLKEIMFSQPTPYFLEFNENVYHTRDLQLRKIMVNYL